MQCALGQEQIKEKRLKKLLEIAMERMGSTAVAITPPNLTAEDLTPIVLSQLQSTSRSKEGNRKLRFRSFLSISLVNILDILDIWWRCYVYNVLHTLNLILRVNS